MTRKQPVGLEKSETRTALLEAAERLMGEEGYAAVTSRRLGAYAGVRPQLVHYYFRTIEANSRLSCQIKVTEASDGMIVRLPKSQH